MNKSLFSPKDLLRRVQEYFEKVPAAEVVRRAEQLKPPPDSEPLGMLPEGAKSPLDLIRKEE